MGLDGGNSGPIARFDYAFDAFTASLSAEVGDTPEDEEVIWGVGFAYSADLAGLSLGIGLGYQTQTDNGTVTGLSLSSEFGSGFEAIVNFSQFQEDGGGLPDHNHAAIGLGYSMNALTVGLNYGVYTLGEDDLGLDSGDELSSGFGLAVNYEIGDGLTAQFGYGSSSFADELEDGGFVSDTTSDSYSLGLAMSF